MAAKKKTAKKSGSSVKASGKVNKPKNGTQYSQSEFFDVIQDCCQLESRRMAKDVYNSFAGMIQAALKKGYKVPLPGIGKIQVRQSKARWGRNPATGEQIYIKARKRVRLTPNKAIKEAVL